MTADRTDAATTALAYIVAALVALLMLLANTILFIVALSIEVAGVYAWLGVRRVRRMRQAWRLRLR